MSESFELETFLILKGKRKGGTIENWRVIDDPWFTDRKIVIGEIIGDSMWPQEEYRPRRQNFTTSGIVEIHTEENIVETQNSFYKLGVPEVLGND